MLSKVSSNLPSKFRKPRVSVINAESQFSVIKAILSKPPEQRSTFELRTMAPLLGNIGFFKKRKLKPQEMNEVCYGLQYTTLPRNSMVIRYGELGDSFYIILKGKCSVWAPVPAEEMRRPLALLKENLKRKAGKSSDHPDLDFKFPKRVLDNELVSKFGKINPLSKEEGDESSDSEYVDEEEKAQAGKEWCTYKDYEARCSEKLSETEKQNNWRNFVKERASEMIFEAEKFSIRFKRHVLVHKEDGLFTDVVISS